MTTAALRLRHHHDPGPVREALLQMYADVRAPLLHLPGYQVPAFAERLDQHATEPDWEAVFAYDDGDEPVGYIYANTLTADDRWWKRMIDPLPAGYTAVPTLVIREFGVRTPWRGTGIARRIHDDLLAHRTEDRVTLLVNPAAGNGKVQALYESWGYTAINSQQLSPDSPRLTAMARPRHNTHLPPAGPS
jgi:GNAT superfamily N-acetyltransferase